MIFDTTGNGQWCNGGCVFYQYFATLHEAEYRRVQERMVAAEATIGRLMSVPRYSVFADDVTDQWRQTPTGDYVRWRDIVDALKAPSPQARPTGS